MRILGHIDRCDESFIKGWIVVPETPDTKIPLEFVLNGNVLGLCVADHYRQDIKDADLGDGTCAFSFAIPAFIPKSEIKKIAVRLENSLVILPNDTTTTIVANTTPVRETVSRLRGLWIDR